jgi:hypothetical protein
VRLLVNYDVVDTSLLMLTRDNSDFATILILKRWVRYHFGNFTECSGIWIFCICIVKYRYVVLFIQASTLLCYKFVLLVQPADLSPVIWLNTLLSYILSAHYSPKYITTTFHITGMSSNHQYMQVHILSFSALRVKSQCSSGSTVSGYELDDRAIEVRSLAEAKEFFL